MITYIAPEKGGESEGIIRLEMTLPIHPAELSSLRRWLHDYGWSIEVEQIDAYLAGEDWSA